MTKTNYGINPAYIIITALIVLLSWWLHEFAHWATGEALGYNMAMSFNKSYPESGVFTSDRHYQIVSAAGPLFTIIQAIVFWQILLKTRNIIFFPLLFTPLYMRILALALSPFNPNDEARIGIYLGWGPYVLLSLVVIFLAALFWHTKTKLQLPSKFIWLTLAFIIFFSSIIILTDQYFKPKMF